MGSDGATHFAPIGREPYESVDQEINTVMFFAQVSLRTLRKELYSYFEEMEPRSFMCMVQRRI